MSDLPTPELRPDDDRDPPGGPWRSWGSIYATLAVWGVLCIGFLIWLTATGNVALEFGP